MVVRKLCAKAQPVSEEAKEHVATYSKWAAPGFTIVEVISCPFGPRAARVSLRSHFSADPPIHGRTGRKATHFTQTSTMIDTSISPAILDVLVQHRCYHMFIIYRYCILESLPGIPVRAKKCRHQRQALGPVPVQPTDLRDHLYRQLILT